MRWRPEGPFRTPSARTLKNSLNNPSFCLACHARPRKLGAGSLWHPHPLKELVHIQQPTNNPYVPVLLQQLKDYGLFTADGSSYNWEIYSDGKGPTEALIQTAYAELQNAANLTANFEVVDESTLNNNDGTAMVAPGNSAVSGLCGCRRHRQFGVYYPSDCPAGVGADVPDSVVFISGRGASRGNLPHIPPGTQHSGFSWSTSPSIGSITSGGEYTPPASVATPTLVTATVTSTANPDTV